MDATRFDTIATFFADRRLSRRRAIAQGGAGLAAGALAAAGLARSASTQDATPDATPAAASPSPNTAGTAFLFVQSFESGSIAAKAGADGAYTATLQHGLGQTIYFSDRPDRIVGASPTPQFLDGLGFTPDNPPNAAIVVDDGSGGVNVAVVELTNPSYDEASRTATYDLTVLADYEAVDMRVQEAPADLSALGDSFGATHLFIDDCADQVVVCQHWRPCCGLNPSEGSRSLGPQGFCWNWGAARCDPCFPQQLRQQCYTQFPDFCNADHDCWF